MGEKKDYSERKFLFLYLNSGNGHIAQAKVLKQAFEEVAPEAEVTLLNGFEKNRLGRILFEKFYALACNYIHGAYPLIYDISFPRLFLQVSRTLIHLTTSRFLLKKIEELGITDIVSFHFGMTPAVYDIVKKLKRKVNLTVICTDPFTAHPSWFFFRQQDLLVGSEGLRKYAIEKCGYNPKKIHVAPILVNKKFIVPATEQQKLELRRKYGFDEHKKIVLLAGGGEGLPGTERIISQCIIHKSDFSVAVVCGRNHSLEQTLELVAKANPQIDIHVFGFVDFMNDLIKLSDLVISKAGTSTVMEIVSNNKPVIISNYIHNQELGNMRFVVDNHVGYFIRHSSEIYKKICEIFESDEAYDKISKRFHGIEMDLDSTKIAKYLLEK